VESDIPTAAYYQSPFARRRTATFLSQAEHTYKSQKDSTHTDDNITADENKKYVKCALHMRLKKDATLVVMTCGLTAQMDVYIVTTS